MSNFAINAGKKILKGKAEKRAPLSPLYEIREDERGRERRHKRELPPGLSKRDQKILQSVRKRAHYLDRGISLCGMRFGWTFIIGIIPGAGDVADAILAYTLVTRKARQADIPDSLVREMLMNNALSVAGGVVPIAGDIWVAYFRTNSRNAFALEKYLVKRGEQNLEAERRAQLAAPGEQANGTAVEKKSSSGSRWFSRKSSKSSKSQGKEKAVETKRPTAPSVVQEGSRGSRFVENWAEPNPKVDWEPNGAQT
ncbi:hypothetical protein EIP91_007715 [Steccherinum ochraceum]|uniref:DUF4112 domain-containing protein n=1 Tax=Steccherinum ochraceum TaxID=92696 RepID=A0A4R0R6J3_9APHY|nr:hypothetical protein EIP91_007715 [Steccherinum ochraceum]